MSNTTHHHNDLEFDIVKRNDIVVITCIDKTMHKSYQTTYDKITIENMLLLNNVDNFYNIINHAFNNKELLIITEQHNVKIHINTSISQLLFEFDIVLEIMNSAEVTTTIYIEKLQNRIKMLEDYVYESEFIVAYRTVGDAVGVFLCDAIIDTFEITFTGYTYNFPFIQSIHYNNINKKLSVVVGASHGWTTRKMFKKIKTNKIVYVKQLDLDVEDYFKPYLSQMPQLII